MVLRTAKLVSLLLLMVLLILVAATHAMAQTAKDLGVAIFIERKNPVIWGIANRIKQTIEDSTKGSLKVRLLGQEVGGERDCMEGTSRNEYQMAVTGDLGTTYYAPKYGVTGIPFVFPDYALVRGAYEGKMGEKLNESFKQMGNLRIIGISLRGSRNLTANKPIYGPEDLKGLKLRLPEIKSWVEIWKQLGALPTPVAWPEVFTSLQTGVVEGQETPFELIYSAKLYEVQKYVMLTEHLPGYWHWVINDSYLRSLDAKTQKLVLDVTKEATEWGSKLQVKLEGEWAVEMQKKYNVRIIVPNRNAFFKGAKPAIERIAERDWAPEAKEYTKTVLRAFE